MVSMALNYNRIKRQLLSRVYLKRGILITAILVLLGISIKFIFLPSFGFTKSAWKLTQIKLPQSSGRTNFLILGVGGGSHEGSDLTDSMAVVSVQVNPPDVAIITLPRDLWITSLRAKINTMYHYGQEKQFGGGLILAKSTVSEVLGIPIHFAALIDFSGFEKVIDALGGIEIDVLNPFEDQKYPIAGKENDVCEACRYETIKFEKGKQIMDGKTALKFTRSRYSESDEGSDFARSKRQEQVMKAIRDKIAQNPLKIIDLQKLIKDLVKTDISPDLYPAIIKLGLAVYKTSMRSTSITQLYTPPISPKYDLQWVLMPKNDDYSIISSYIKDFLSAGVQ